MKRPIQTVSLALLLAASAAPAFAMKIFVSNEKDNTVTVVDGDTLEVIKTIPTARRPRGIIASPDGKEVYVAAGDGDIMDVIDTEKLEVTRELDSGPDPELMAVDPQGGTLYIANEDDSMVTVMDVKSGDVLEEVPVGVEPEGVGVSPDSKYTVATSESTSMAHVIDNADYKLVANVLVDTRPREAKFKPDGSEVWVSSEVGGTISVIDAKTWKVKKKIGFEVAGVRPSCSSPSAWSSPRTANICSWRSGRVTAIAVIDPKTYEVKDYILVGQRPWHLELSPDQTKLYVANGLTNDLTVIDVESLKAEKSVKVGTAALGRGDHALGASKRKGAPAKRTLPKFLRCCSKDRLLHVLHGRRVGFDHAFAAGRLELVWNRLWRRHCCRPCCS